MTFDMVIPHSAGFFFTSVVSWLALWFAFTALNFALGGYYPRYCVINGGIWATSLMVFCYVISSVFTGSPLPIQLINITVGAP